VSSQAVWAPATVSPGAILVSPFNVKWRFSAPAGDVEGSKLCLFSVIMPAKCVSGVSPRFHYRRLTFCFLPLAAIMEFSFLLLLNGMDLHSGKVKVEIVCRVQQKVNMPYVCFVFHFLYQTVMVNSPPICSSTLKIHKVLAFLTCEYYSF
jgi:hypothetical protein